MARGDGFSKPSPSNDSGKKQGVFAMRAKEVWARSRKASTKPWRRAGARCASFQLPTVDAVTNFHRTGIAVRVLQSRN
jgi:hypothetical protein